MSDAKFQILPDGFSEQNQLDVGLLAETIQQYEFIYHTGHPEYKNVNKKNLAWEEIAACLNCPVVDCQRTWKSLRDRFAKEKNKIKSKSHLPHSNWPYFNVMLFYTKYSKPRKTYTSSLKKEQTLSRSSTSNSVLPIDEIKISPSSSSTSSSPCRSKREKVTVSKGTTKKQKTLDEKDTLHLVKDTPAPLETVAAKSPLQSSNSNRAFADYIFMRLEEMQFEESKMKRRQIFTILES